LDFGVIAVGVGAILAFAGAFHVSGLVARARIVMATANEAMAVMADKSLDDDAKEARAQAASIKLFGHAGIIFVLGALVLAAPAAAMWLGGVVGLADFDSSLAFLMRWDVIVVASFVFIALIWLAGRRK